MWCTFTHTKFNVVYFYPYQVQCCVLLPIPSSILCTFKHTKFNVVYFYPYQVQCCVLLPIPSSMLCTFTHTKFNVAYFYPYQVQCGVLLPIPSSMLCTFTHTKFNVVYFYPYQVYWRICFGQIIDFLERKVERPVYCHPIYITNICTSGSIKLRACKYRWNNNQVKTTKTVVANPDTFNMPKCRSNLSYLWANHGLGKYNFTFFTCNTLFRMSKIPFKSKNSYFYFYFHVSKYSFVNIMVAS